MLQRQLTHPKSLAKFDSALRSWADHDTALANIVTHDRLAAVLNTRDYECHDSILHTLLQRAALLNDEGIVAAQIVLTAMLAAVPGIARRVIRASRTAVSTFGTRRGLTGGGVSATETNTDVQASVIGHLWEQIRCYPIRRHHHVAANVVRETQRAALRTLGIDITQAAAEVISINSAPYQQFVDEPAEKDASEELLELLSWAFEQRWLDEHESAILTARYFGEHMGRDGVATDRQLGEIFGVSQPTATRRRNRALDTLDKSWPRMATTVREPVRRNSQRGTMSTRRQAKQRMTAGAQFIVERFHLSGFVPRRGTSSFHPR